jgi:hypothetical protein
VYKNRSVLERGDPRIIPPLRNWPSVSYLAAGVDSSLIRAPRKGKYNNNPNPILIF